MSGVFTALIVSEELSMKLDWLVDVLMDMRVYARTNDLHVLAEHLDDAVMVAYCEMATLDHRKGSVCQTR